jgi:glycosyltransferase involved in cell wall biosynthesis
MKLIGVSPGRTFSGFQTSFFESLKMQGANVDRIEVELPLFRMFCLMSSFHPIKKKWGPRLSHDYYMTTTAFNKKSAFVRKRVMRLQSSADAIYQIGSLWNPLSSDIDIPLFLQVDYTSKLSKKRKGGWKINAGEEEIFWIEQELKLYESAALVFTTTENARRSLLEDYGVAPEKVIAVGAGVSSPFDLLNPERLPAYGSKKMLFIGKGFEGKGLDTVLEAFEIVKRTVPDAKLTIAGPTGLKFDIEGVDYLGRIADKDAVKELYYQHSLFVMPSRFEPFGQVFLEAMACQLPCIGTTMDAMPEIIEHNVTGFTIEPGDSVALADHMTKILQNHDFAMNMGRAGFERLRSRYTWPIVGKKILDNMKRRITEIKSTRLPRS